MNKLYEVEIIYNVIIAADDCDDALYIASTTKNTIVNDSEPTDFEICDCITKVSELCDDWGDVVPYGNSNGGQTCKEILAENDENEKKKYIESLTDEQKVQLLSTLTLSDIANLLNKKDN